MIKYFLYIILIISVTAVIIGAFHLYRVTAKNKKEMAQYEGQSVEINQNFGKVLIIYYSLTGHTKDIAEKIRSKTNADMYEIKTSEPFPTGAKIHLKVKEQLKSGEYPKLTDDLPDLSAYDIIFIGAPVWWYTVATPVLSYLKQVDFQNKKVVPFSTQGSNVGTFFEDFRAKAKNAKILPHASFNNLSKEYDSAVEAKIAAWLNSL